MGRRNEVETPKRSAPINSTKQGSGGDSKTGDRLIFAKKTAKKNLSPQAWIVPINSSEFRVFLTGFQQ